MTKMQNYGLYKWLKMTNKIRVKKPSKPHKRDKLVEKSDLFDSRLLHPTDASTVRLSENPSCISSRMVR